MAQRGAGARFMGGAWVFPGGVVDEDDGAATAREALDNPDLPDAAWRAAALRELIEEAGVWLAAEPISMSPAERPHGAAIYAAAAAAPERRLAAGSLRYFSNWITPTVVPIRFDARFYVAQVTNDVVGIADGVEMDAVEWVHPDAALGASRRGEFVLPLPTRRTLRHFARLGTPAAILDFASSQASVPPIQPRLRTDDDGSLRAVLPGEAGYEDLTDDPPDEAALRGAARVTTLDGEPIPELQRRED
jgi:8-oxo-dGTP pyrophosphatase MutT (NUDIX family)